MPILETFRAGPGCTRAGGALMLAALLAFLPPPAFADAGQDRIQREMVEGLEAYVPYKMGRYEEAFALFLKLAEKGNRQGILNVARMYQAGQGVGADAEKALEWYLKAAELGDNIALHAAAEAYDKGEGAPRDGARALELYRRAAEAGSTEAQLALAAKLMAEGKTGEARPWLERAQAAGDPEAPGRLARLEAGNQAKAEVTGESLAAVQRMLAALDAAANARDADALTGYVAPEARIRVTLPTPGVSGPQELTPATYRELWRTTFAKAGGYRFSRLGFEVSADGPRVRVKSKIRETFDTAGRQTALHIDETLTVSFGAPTPAITAVELVATQE